MKLKKTIMVISLIALIFTGCSKHNPKIHKNHIKHHTIRTNSNYTMPNSGYGNMGVRGGYNPNSAQLTPAHSMQELDEQSRSVKPTMVYSFPRGEGTRGTNFVNLMPLRFKLLGTINHIRAYGAPCSKTSAQPVRWNKKLEDAAKAHTQDMALHHFLGHIGSGTSSDMAKKALGVGSNFYERIIFFGYPIQPGQLAGEIITYTKFRIVGNRDTYENFKHAIDNFLRSPKHCALLMNPRFSDIGVAAYKDNEKIYWDIEFGEAAY